VEQKRNLRPLWYVIAVSLVVFAGQQTHFAFQRLGGPVWLAWLFPINESAFEHIKMAVVTLPIMIIAIRLIDGIRGGALVAAFAVSLLVAFAIEQGVFYVFYWIMGGHNLIVSIILFVIGQAAACTAAYFVAHRFGSWNPVWIVVTVLAAIHIAAMVATSYATPRWEVYRDTEVNLYGLDAAEHYLENGHEHEGDH